MLEEKKYLKSIKRKHFRSFNDLKLLLWNGQNCTLDYHVERVGVA